MIVLQCHLAVSRSRKLHGHSTTAYSVYKFKSRLMCPHYTQLHIVDSSALSPIHMKLYHNNLGVRETFLGIPTCQ